MSLVIISTYTPRSPEESHNRFCTCVASVFALMIHEFDSWSGVLHAISEALVWLDAVNFTLVRLAGMATLHFLASSYHGKCILDR